MAANPQDAVIAEDLYGGRMRLNPNSNERSYATRRFRVRLEPDWVEGSGVDPPFNSATPPVGKQRRAILAAVGTDYDHPNLDGLAIQDITATQVGPWDFDVQADYYQTQTGGLTGVAESTLITTRQSSVPVYRTVWNDAGQYQINSTSKLPSGNFAGLGDGQQLPRGASYEDWKYEWPITEALVQVNADLNSTQYAAVLSGTGAMGIVNYFNTGTYTPFTGGEVTFAAQTLKFIGLSTNSTIVGGNRKYSISYTFLWRPLGWYEQRLTTSGATAGYFKTVDVALATAANSTAFNSTRFPT